MTDREKEELIAALEKATGPDRELSNEVLFACGWRMEEFGAGDNPSIYWTAPDGEEMLDGDHPHPTESVDAAMTLVPEGHDISITQASGPDRKDWSAICVKRKFYGNAVINRARASSGAIALCCSALKARAALNGEKKS